MRYEPILGQSGRLGRPRPLRRAAEPPVHSWAERPAAERTARPAATRLERREAARSRPAATPEEGGGAARSQLGQSGLRLSGRLGRQQAPENEVELAPPEPSEAVSMRSSCVCMRLPRATPNVSAGIPRAIAAFASVEPASSSIRQRELAPRSPARWPGAERLATVARRAGARCSSTTSDSGSGTASAPSRSAKRLERRLVERPQLDDQLGCVGDRVDRPPARDEADVDRASPDSPAPSSSPAISSSAWIALGSPRFTHEWPPGPVTRTRARRLPTASTSTCSSPWPSTATRTRSKRFDRRRSRPRRLPSPSSPTVNATAPAVEPLAAQERLDDVDRDRDGGRVVADPGADEVSVLDADVELGLGGEDRVDVRGDEDAGRALAPGPDEIPDLVAVSAVRRAPARRRSSQASRAVLRERRRRDRRELDDLLGEVEPPPTGDRAARRRARASPARSSAVDVRAGVDRAAVGDVVARPRRERRPTMPSSSSAEPPGREQRIQADRDLGEVAHPLVARALERVRAGARPPAPARRPAVRRSKRSSTGSRELVGAEEEDGAVDHDHALGRPLDRAGPDLDVGRRRVAARPVGDAPERPAAPAGEAAAQIGAAALVSWNSVAASNALGEPLGPLAERVRSRRRTGRRVAGSSR